MGWTMGKSPFGEWPKTLSNVDRLIALDDRRERVKVTVGQARDGHGAVKESGREDS